ncbi:MAG: PEGA domain-containing protein [SAR86 cluster bacterium]|uniref:PEGA domain-containing protein n=1 Tax=SAR86 cluster bacterium TaxID=2030880 RepID=A0A2A4XJ60_9GAMM|nr:MAG: PEGA domain-containing protein [SAR86 cluster bacterium]
MKHLLILVTMLVTACSSSTVIRSSDPESRIYVNGEYMGTGRAVYTDQKVAFSKNDVEIRKDGCVAENYSFRRSEEADVGAIIGGIFLTVPFLWVTEYKPHHGYDFECVPSRI